MIDRRIYLPASWSEDQPRCAAAGVPEQVSFAAKPRLALDMVASAVDAGVPARWVTADEVLGFDAHGSYRCSRGDVVKVIGGTESDTVIVVATRVDRRPCPRPDG